MQRGHRTCSVGLISLDDLSKPRGGVIEGIGVERSVKGGILRRFTCLPLALVKTAATSGELAVLPGTSASEWTALSQSEQTLLRHAQTATYMSSRETASIRGFRIAAYSASVSLGWSIACMRYSIKG